jgi:phytoene dehydrogenase-like protein
VASSAPLEFDVVVVGGGISGLIAAAYMAKTGLKTLLVERRDKVGTHISTEEPGFPGFWISPHATSIHMGNSPAMVDLELERFGLNLVVPRFNRALPFRDGKVYLQDCYDANNTYKKLKRFSERDAKVFRDIQNAVAMALFREIYHKVFYAEPTPENMEAIISTVSRLPHIPEDWWDMTAFELVDHLFESEYVKTAVITYAQSIGMYPFDKFAGTVMVVLRIPLSPTQQAIGGSYQVPHSVLRCLLHYGGKVLTGCEVERIIVKDGTAQGIILSEHSPYPNKTIIARRAIIADISPVPLFLKMIGSEHLDKSVVLALKMFEYRPAAMFSAHYLLRDKPKFICAEWDPDIQQAWMFNLGVDKLEDVERYFLQLQIDKYPDPLVALGDSFDLSIYDPHVAPAGYRNMQFWTCVPYNIRRHGGAEKWDELKERTNEQIKDLMEEYAPGFKKMVEYEIYFTPLDTYRRNPSAVMGSFTGGTAKPGHLYFDKPFLGCNPPRTPIKNLYLCNGIWPVGTSAAPSGYIAVNTVIKDLGIRKPDWWSSVGAEWLLRYLERHGIRMQHRVTVG